MTNQNWKESMKSFRSQIDPEMEERLKWTKLGNYQSPEHPLSIQYHHRFWDSSIANNRMQLRARQPAQLYPQLGIFHHTEWQRVRKTENKLKKCLKIIKSINNNREGNFKKKIELTHLIEEISNDYQSMYAQYDHLTSEVRKLFGGKNEAGSPSSASNSDSEYYSPDEPSDRNGEHQNAKENDNEKLETPDSEDAFLKYKLTSTSEIKNASSIEALSPGDEEPKSGLIIKDLEIQEDKSLNMRQELLMQFPELKEKLRERDEEILSINKKHRAFEDRKLAEIKALETEVTSLTFELNKMSVSQRALEEQVDKANQMREENSGLQIRIAELEHQLKEMENQLSSLVEKLEEDKKGLQEQNNYLKKELEFVGHQKSAPESQLKSKSQEVSERLLEMEKLREELAKRALHEEGITKDNVSPQVKEEDLELEISSLSSQKRDLENQIISIKSEAYNRRVENERLYEKISVLETAMKERESELSTLREKLKVQENEMPNRIRSLTEELQNLRQELDTLRQEKTGLKKQLHLEKQNCSQNLTHIEKNNVELTKKIADQQKSLTGLEHIVNKLTEENKQIQGRLGDAKSNYLMAERKAEDMAEEFFKKCEDKVRILSRRIRVAEQLHVENKEWYLKTKDRYEQQNKESKERLEKNEIWLRNIKDMSLSADKTLSALGDVALKFAGCTANFQNRISKVSCELKFAKDWIKRKNKAMLHVRDDLNCLLAQLDDKEAEILLYREKVWKSDHKVRELEKTMNEKEEQMLALKEEKREAIRQLCVWIDYHRSHSDFYKKVLSDMNGASKKQR